MVDTVVITGAHGFIGRHTALRFNKKGWRVIGMGHGEWSDKSLSDWGLSEWYSCNVTIETLLDHAKKPEAIIHCAGGGSVGHSISNPSEDFERTVVTTSQIVEYARKYSPNTHILYPSSAAVYGRADKIPISESGILNPISPYGHHKRMAEDLVNLYSKSFGLKCSVVRLFSVYGNGLCKQLLWDACNKVKVGDLEFGGSGEEVRDWIHVKDVARLFELAVSHASTECPVVNGASGKGVKTREILELLFHDLSVNHDPLFSGQVRTGDPDIYIADVQRSRQWGFEPKKELSVGIKEYADWFNDSVT